MGVAKLSEEDKRFLLGEHLLNVGYMSKKIQIPSDLVVKP